MATTASQIIFHPVVSQSLKFGGTTLGRDKVLSLTPQILIELTEIRLHF